MILRILIFLTGTRSTIRFVYERFKCKRKKIGKKRKEKSAMREGEAPKGYCHEKLWILELGEGGRFFIYLVSVEVLSRNMVKTSTCRSFIQTLVKTSTCRSFIQNWVKTST